MLSGASLVALPKPSGDLRPIVVGETWRRLTAKLLSQECTREIRAKVLGPLAARRRWCILRALELENALNSSERSALLQAGRPCSPGLVPWADFFYKQHSNLLLGETRLASELRCSPGPCNGPYWPPAKPPKR